MTPTPCLHTGCLTLCDACREEYETDGEAYEAYGHHIAGRLAWREEMGLIDRDRAEAAQDPTPADDRDIPF